MTDFPKVLIITKTLINDIDSGGASLRNWFKEWPCEHLAQLYSSVAINRDPFCGFNFQIGLDERRFGKLFSKLKGSTFGDAAQPFRHSSGSTENRNSGWWKKAIYKASNLLTQSGFWELMFPPLLSPSLKKWIETFHPDVLFFQGSDITFMRLPLIIHKAYEIPVCMNTVDDWVEHIYEKTPLAPLLQNVVRKTFHRLVGVCSQRFTIGDLMAKEYQARYGVPFKPLMQCDDKERFATKLKNIEQSQEIQIVYSGSLALDRWRSLTYLAEAAERLRPEGLEIEIVAYAPFVPGEARDTLQKFSALTVCSPSADSEVPRVLSAADILFLPESFNKTIRSYIKLSVSTKVHLYMMSGRPALVYGPPEIGTVDYARREGCGGMWLIKKVLIL